MRMLNQNRMVINHLVRVGAITQADAYDLYGITRLSARIFDLRKSGYQVLSRWREKTNRYGIKVRFLQYYLPGEFEEEIKDAKVDL